MFTFENRVGRLIEIRVAGALRADDLPTFRVNVMSSMSRVDGRAVVCTDLRAMDLLPVDVFDPLSVMLRANIPKIERHAIIVSTAPVMALQMQRLVEEGGSAARRVFRQVNEAIDWLGTVLTREESDRMRTFLTPAW